MLTPFSLAQRERIAASGWVADAAAEYAPGDVALLAPRNRPAATQVLSACSFLPTLSTTFEFRVGGSGSRVYGHAGVFRMQLSTNMR